MPSSRFLASFSLTGGAPVDAELGRFSVGEWMDAAGGRSFSGGLYRVHSSGSSRAANELVRAAFPEFAGRFVCFGYDWLGRQFATDSARGGPDDPEILMFEPGTGEALEIPVAFSQFHDQELVDCAEEALARDFFSQWRGAGGGAPALDECIGYRKPLFLGGVDSVENLELIDLDVYWTVMGQFRGQVIELPHGTRISEVRGES